MPTRRPSLAAVLVLVVTAACGSTTPSPTPASAPPATPVATEAPTGPSLTPVPGVPSDEPIPPPVTNPSTTETEWGTIRDEVPEDFVVYPGAKRAEWPDGPSSGAWITDAGIDEVATWYRDTFEELGQSIDDLSAPLEDGTRILESRTDLPECRIRSTFHPAGESTMIVVLYGAGCGPF